MKRILPVLASLPLLSLYLLAQDKAATPPEYWPAWRGPLGSGVAVHADPPTGWSESKNIRWKVTIPGRGHASPIVWGERVYVQTAIPTDKVAESQPAASPDWGRPPGGPPRPEGPEATGRPVLDKGEGAPGPRRPGGNFDQPPPRPPPPGRSSGAEAPTSAPQGGPPRPPVDTSPVHLHGFVLLALDRRTGKTVWEQTLCEAAPHERGQVDASQASNSPVTDGEHIFAYFGSRGLYCLDMAGNLIWKKNLGEMHTRMGFGEGSSPALYGDTLVIAWDQEGGSFIVALDKHSGEERWRVDRDEVTSWATPIVLNAGDKPQVVASATKRIRSYDLATGKLLWECAGMTANAIPSPVSANGLVYCTSGFRGSALLAIRYAEAQGDITDTPAVAWSYEGRGTPYVPSPVLYGEELYFLQENKGVLSCVNAKTGQAHYSRQRLESVSEVYASPVAAAGRVYIAGRAGTTVVIEAGPEFRVLATNALDDSFTASPAIVDREIYLRGLAHLYCIAAE